MAISLKISGTSYTLQQASIRSLVHTVTAGQPASLAGEIYTTAIPSTALAYGDLVELWVNSVRRFCGWLGPVTTGFDAQGSYVRIEARDILHRLRNTPLAKRIVSEAFSRSASGLDHYIYTLADITTTEVRLFGGGFVPDEEAEGYYRWQYGSSSEAELARICDYAGTVYSPGLDLGTTAGLSTENQSEDVVNLDCLAALQRCTKYRPDAILWVDASGTTPALHCITRDNCTAVTLDLSARDRIRGWSLSAREDLRLLYLRSRFGYLEHLVVALYSHCWLMLVLLTKKNMDGIMSSMAPRRTRMKPNRSARMPPRKVMTTPMEKRSDKARLPVVGAA